LEDCSRSVPDLNGDCLAPQTVPALNSLSNTLQQPSDQLEKTSDNLESAIARARQDLSAAAHRALSSGKSHRTPSIRLSVAVIDLVTTPVKGFVLRPGVALKLSIMFSVELIMQQAPNSEMAMHVAAAVR
jgi:hypothetical protein